MTKSDTVTKSLELAGRTLVLETGRLAPRSSSAVLARYGETSVLAAVTIGKEDLKKDYFPLSVDYQERLYAGGRIKGSRWVKREGRPTDAEVLSGRLIDRSVRPLFPKTFKNEVQIIITVLSTDTDNDADVLALNAASAALAISPIPWTGPVAAVRVGLVAGQLEVNPKDGNKNGVDLDLVVTSTSDLVTMLEAGANQVPETRVFEAIEVAHRHNSAIIKLIDSLIKDAGKDKLLITSSAPDPQLVADVTKVAKTAIAESLDYARGKPILEREYALDIAKETVAQGFDEPRRNQVRSIVDDLFQKQFRQNILDKQVRADGRAVDAIRPLTIEAGVLPRVHGSAIFQRGETQALTVTTLGAPSQYQSLESAEGESEKRYMHHYYFPPFSTGETGKVGSPGRREIGHGALAERALTPVIPPESQFPYAIRVVSEILSSNGSTSMASTCGSTMSLMDAGVPLAAPVAGISTGLVTPVGYPDKTDGYVLLTDINGGEDHYGDMDFKVAGTAQGVTAIQLDVKVPGLTLDIVKETLTRARAARDQIMAAMLKVLAGPRPELSPYAPRITTVQIPVDKIGELIGPGGKNIKKLMADYKVTIDVNDNGSVFISGTADSGLPKVIDYLTAMGKEIAVGEVYEGPVVNIMPFGAFVNILPGRDGLVHVSQMSAGFTSDPGSLVTQGQMVRVWVTEVDTTTGKVGLSMLFDAEGNPVVKEREPRPTSDRPTSRPPGHFSAPQSRHGRRDDRRGSRW